MTIGRTGSELRVCDRRASRGAILASMLLLLGAPLACTNSGASADKKATTRTSEAALTDPYGKWSNVDTNISGNGPAAKPDKGGWKEDLDRLLMK